MFTLPPISSSNYIFSTLNMQQDNPAYDDGLNNKIKEMQTYLPIKEIGTHPISISHLDVYDHLAATASWGGSSIKLWDLQNGKCKWTLEDIKQATSLIGLFKIHMDYLVYSFSPLVEGKSSIVAILLENGQKTLSITSKELNYQHVKLVSKQIFGSIKIFIRALEKWIA